MSVTVAARVDAESLIVQYLVTRSEITALTNTRVNTRVDPASPSIRVTRLGGVGPYPGRMDHPRVQIECYGTTETQSADLCGLARAALFDIAGVHALGVVTSCDEYLGEQHLPDPVGTPGVAPRERYLFAVALTTHPNT